MKSFISRPLLTNTTQKTEFTKNLMKKKTWVFILCLIGLLGWGVEGMGQQVIGSFPNTDGGFEGQTNGTITTLSAIPTGSQRTDWTVSAGSGSATVNATGGRSGPKCITVGSTSATARRYQSPTAATTALANNTAYTVQFYYKTSSSTAFANGQCGNSPDGTLSPGTYAAITMSGTSNVWTRIQQSQTSGSSMASTRYGVSVFRVNGVSSVDADIDDFVIYAGAADNTAPGSPGTVTVNNATTTTLDVGWGAASSVDGGGYVVVRYSTSPNADNDPNQNGIYAVGNTTTNGTGSLTGTIRYIGTALSFTDNVGLSAGTTYYYKVYTVDKAFNYSGESEGNGATNSSCTPPSSQATSITFSSVGSTTISVGWTRGSGDAVLLVAKSASAATDPTNGTTYTGNASFGSEGTQCGGGFAVYSASGTSVAVTNLAAETQYFFNTYEYTTSSNCFKTPALAGSRYTLSTEPSAHPSSFTASPVSSTQIDLSFSAASTITNADGYLILQRQGSDPTGIPTDATTYTVGNTIGDATLAAIISSNSTTTASISGLNASTQYNFSIIPFNANASQTAETYNYYTAATIKTAIATSNAPCSTNPSIATTVAVNTVGVTTASSGGQTIGAGSGCVITAKGVCWSTSPTPLAGGSHTTDTPADAANFTSSISALSAQTLYYVRAYATNSFGTAYGNEVSFRTLSTEPTSQPASFSASPFSTSQIDLSFSAASTITNAYGYIILQRQGANPTGVPTDATAYSVGNTIGDATVAAIINSSSATSTSITSLAANTQYNYSIIPFSYDGSHAQTYNYYIGGSIKTANATTYKIEPSNQPSSLAVGSVTTVNIPLTWTAANAGVQAPDGYLIKLTTSSVTDPVDGTDPSNITVISGGAGNNKVTPGSTTAYGSFSAWSAGTMYNFKIYSYTNSGTKIDFLLTSPPSINHATLPEKVTGTSTIAATGTTTADIAWTLPASYNATNHSVLVFVKANSSITIGTPTNAPATYTANTVFTSGTAYQGDAAAYCVYKGDGTSVSITGLLASTTYHVLIYTVVDASNSNATNSYSAKSTAYATTYLNEPTSQPTNFAVGGVTTSSIPLNWSVASPQPASYIIKLNTYPTAVADPVDGTDPADNTAISGGIANKDATGGASSATTFTGMTAGTMYNYKIYSFNNSGNYINFLTTAAPSLNQATLPNAATFSTFTPTGPFSADISWGSATGYNTSNHSTVVFVKATSSITIGTPTNAPAAYTANTVFASGTAYQGDAAAYCVFNGDGTSVSITGLSANTTYHVLIYTVVDASNSNATNSYSAAAPGSGTTNNIAAPTAAAASDISSTGFTASWGAVTGATSYRLDVATTDQFSGTVTPLSENFAGCSAGTFGTPDANDVSATLNTYLQTSGWTGTYCYQAGGALKLGKSGSYQGSLTSKTTDLSGYSGNATLNFDLQTWSADATVIQVFHAADGTSFTQIGTDITAPSGMATQTISITGGTANSKIKIAAKTALNHRFYLDNISITQSNSSNLTGYNNLTVNATSQAVTGLSCGTTYYYRVRAYSANSTSANSNTVTVDVKPAAPSGTASQSFCSGASPTVAGLVAAGEMGATYKWYAASSGGTSLATSAALTSTHYYASQTLGSCESAARFDVAATVNTTPIAPTGNVTQYFCIGSLPSVNNLVATGSAVKWYAAPTGGSALPGTDPLTNANYYASQTTSGCESVLRLDVMASIVTSGLWSGAISDDWINVNNWCGATLPLASTNVEIPTGATVHVTLDPASPAICNNLNISSGATLIMDADKALSVSGNWVNNGTFTANSGIITFNGSTPQEIKSGGSPFGNVTINNASGATLNGNATVSKTLTLTSGNIITGSNMLELGSSITQKGTLSRTSGMVVGTMKRWFDGTNSGDALSLFPMGATLLVNDNSLSYFPAKIEFTVAPTTGGSLTAHFITTLPSDMYSGLPLTDGGQIIDNIANEGIWKIDAGNGLIDGTYTCTLSGDNVATVNDASKIHIVKRPSSGGAWTLVGTHGSGSGSGTTVAPLVVTRTNMSGFSEFGFGSKKSENPLPIQLLSFDAKCSNNTIAVNWTTATETNNDYFTVERSANAHHWITMMTLEGSGNSNKILNYAIIDRNPLQGISYYRLTQTDFDGKSETFSPVAVAFSTETNYAINVYPNPFVQNLIFDYRNITDPKATVTIYDFTGKTVFVAEIDLVSDRFVLDLSKLKTGFYYMDFNSNTVNYRTKIVKN
ncbi:MAG: T9SS type A sorting domain-containing protein [Bacteroidota bacterium]